MVTDNGLVNTMRGRDTTLMMTMTGNCRDQGGISSGFALTFGLVIQYHQYDRSLSSSRWYLLRSLYSPVHYPLIISIISINNITNNINININGKIGDHDNNK
jgi:hypothetical protein